MKSTISSRWSWGFLLLAVAILMMFAVRGRAVGESNTASDLITGKTTAPAYVKNVMGTPADDTVYNIVPLLTVGDEMPLLGSTISETFAFAGIPDGLGVVETATGYDVYVNHELRDSAVTKISSTTAGQIKGARVSLLRFDDKWDIVGGKNLISSVMSGTMTYTLNISTGVYADTTGTNLLNGTGSFGRFCSGYLAESGFVDGMGTDAPMWFTAEEGSDPNNRGWAVYPDGMAVALNGLGRYSKEQVLALKNYRASADKTVLLSTEDTENGELYMWVGNQTVADPNGFLDGDLYVLSITGHANETLAEKSAVKATWVMVPDEVAMGPSADLSTWVDVAGRSTNFRRLEDIHEDPNDSGTLYFVTTGRTGTTPLDNTLGKLYRLTLNANNPTGEASIELLQNGGLAKGVSYDNLVVDHNGQVVIQEDETGDGGDIMAQENRQARVWGYDIATGMVKPLLEVTQSEIFSTTVGLWETSGIVEIGSDANLGLSSYLLDVQAHGMANADYIEGGQLLAAIPSGGTKDGRTISPAYAMDIPSDTAEFDIIPLLTVGDEIPMLDEMGEVMTDSTYTVAGIPDGLGLYESADSYTVYMNHELNSNTITKISSSVPGQIKGARVSIYQFNKNWEVMGGRNLIESVMVGSTMFELDTTSGEYKSADGTLLNGTGTMNRFCSGYLAEYGFLSGNANAPIWFAPEEGGLSSLGYAVYPDGHAVALPGLGKYSKETVIAASQYRASADKTVLLVTEDDGDGELYLFVGKQTTADPNGFADGDLYALKVSGVATESLTANQVVSATWTMIPDEIALGTGEALSTWVNAENRTTNFRRLEDIHEDPNAPGTFYFVTTGVNNTENTLGKLYRLVLNSSAVTSTATIELLLNGSPTTGVSYDNLTVDSNGWVVIQEDRATTDGGNIMKDQTRQARIVAYNINTKATEMWLELSQAMVTPHLATDYGTWESSGIVEINSRAGIGDYRSSYLFDVQAHGVPNSNYGESGQLLVAMPAKRVVSNIFLPIITR